jgi:Protein of unknown function (DUF1553)/Protein of unknown function (DUF1549)/Planctomycete cytochrome C
MLRFSTSIIVLLFCTNLRAGDVEFNEHIRPILTEYCLECHGPDANKREGDLRLDVAESAAKVFGLGSPAEQSELYKRITSIDNDLRMPPPKSAKQMNPDQIEKLRRWIAEGAGYEGHWAYEPVSKPAADSSIDGFLLQRLQSHGLSFSPAISRQHWIRRATLDLTGVPPTWEEVEEFVNDQSDSAFERVIDRLLDSPRYGQRWGRHWLDLARYADTLGGAAIGFTKFPFSYTYRDYVIEAFNSDLPYDRFVTEQLAADQLGLPSNHPAQAGLGFLTVGMQYRNKHDIIDDQIDVVTRGLLGLTAACARCHDHKYDAIPTADYYSLYATFASSRSPDRLPLIGEPSGKPYDEYQQALDAAQQEFDDMSHEQSEVMRGRLRMQVGMYLKELVKGTPEQDLSSAFLSFRTDDMRPLVLNRWREFIAKTPENDPVFGIWRQLAKLDAESFAVKAAELRDAMLKENGVPMTPAAQASLAAKPPKWNPRVLDALVTKPPQSMMDVADLYGELFSKVYQEWLVALQATASEAKDGAIVPDEDAKHIDVNSPITRQLRHYLFGKDTPTALPEKEASSQLNRTVQDSLSGRKGAIHGLHLDSPGSPPRAMALEEDVAAGAFHIFNRGNPLERGEPVEARFLSALMNVSSKPFKTGKRRLELAQAIVSEENPLTRRVIVNWVWQQHFGQGLVRTSDDFGTRGRPPTHPQLLDYLATVFLEDRWSIKKLHRRIMLSKAYAQAAEENDAARVIDPDNELLWRMPRRRLELEAMRDSMLYVSGELDVTMGGRPIDLQASPVLPRGSVYGFVNRDIVSSLSSTFDVANPNACTAKRPDTTVPQQTLFALNSEFIQDRAAKLAKLAEEHSTDATARIQWLYQRVYSRSPDEDELKLSLKFVSPAVAEVASAPAPSEAGASKWQQLAHVLLAGNEFVFVD